MGVEGATLQALIGAGGALGGPVLSQLFAPEGQELSSFEGRGRVDPVSMLSQANWLINRLGQATANRAGQPISLPSSYVQQPGAFSGGGLPMPIGLVASDPALANPSLLSLPGMEDFAGMFDHIEDWQSGLVDNKGDAGRGDAPDDKFGGGSGDRADDKLDQDGSGRFASTITPAGQAASAAMDAGPRRRSSGGNLVRTADLINADEGTSDLDQGYGAAQLLLDALREGSTQRTGALI